MDSSFLECRCVSCQYAPAVSASASCALSQREVEALKASVRKLESDTTGDKLSKKVAELTEALEETNGAVALKQKVVSRLTEQLAAAQTEAEKAAQELTQTTTRTQAELDRATESKVKPKLSPAPRRIAVVYWGGAIMRVVRSYLAPPVIA